ncbi:MAG: Glutamate racemase 2 [Firmicutes bacterium ADurb.Bin182]|nr:MAG: Glutamate racemase 2 [Firmicutes bacterium ADurb.Bin182]
MSDRPVGVFDSGLGGASVLREALIRLPFENYVYYGDNGNVPYGDKSEYEITKLAFECAYFLIGKGVKTMLIACNTATSAAIRAIREKLDIPVVSMEPAIKPACSEPGDGKILMMATAATTRLSRYQALKARMPDPGRVIDIPCPGLVDRIETGVFEDDAFDDLLYRFLSPYHGQKIDSIVLGCTHYVFIKNAISRYAALHFEGKPRLVDGNAATVRQLERVLVSNGLNNSAGKASVDFFTSGDADRLRPLFFSLLNRA